MEVMSMLFYEGLSCPVCKIKFTETDDVVVCPQCGLPHHRTCWLTEHRCHEADKHGTPEQWSREKAEANATKGHVPPEGEPQNAQICPRCFTRNPEFAEICTHCGNGLKTSEWSSAQETIHEESYTPYRAAQKPNPRSYTNQERVGENTAAELAAVVGHNADYYLPRFRKIAAGENGGWHWAGFLLGPLWLLFRKQYLLGIFMYVMQMVLSFVTTVLYLPANSAQTAEEMMSAMLQAAESPLFIPAWILSVILMIGRILLGIKGNDLYLHHCNTKIRKMKDNVPDISPAELSSIGGPSLGIAIVSYFASSIILNALITLLIQ